MIKLDTILYINRALIYDNIQDEFQVFLEGQSSNFYNLRTGKNF